MLPYEAVTIMHGTRLLRCVAQSLQPMMIR